MRAKLTPTWKRPKDLRDCSWHHGHMGGLGTSQSTCIIFSHGEQQRQHLIIQVVITGDTGHLPSVFHDSI